jgi:hypothetical protein
MAAYPYLVKNIGIISMENAQKPSREKTKEVNSELRYLEALMIQLGMIDKQ